MRLSVKNQTFFLVSSVLFLAFFVATAVVYLQEAKKLRAAQEAHATELRYAYEKVRSRYEQFYASRIMANIGSQGVKEALLAQDKQKLLELIEGRWSVLKKENEHLVSMRFYLPDTTLLLQMEKKSPTLYETNIYRGVIRDVSQKKVPIQGFEEGGGFLTYKIAYPVFYENRFIGSMEFGLESEFFLKEIYGFYKLQSALYTKQSQQLQIASKLGGYYQQYTTLEDPKIIKNFPAGYDFEPLVIITSKEERSIGVYSFDIQDYSGANIAKLLFFSDFTRERDALRGYLFTSGIIFFLLTLGVLGLIYLVFNRNIKLLEKKYENMSQYRKMIDEHVITATLDLHCNIVDVSEAFLEKTGYKKSFLIGKKYRFLGYPDVSNEIYEKMYKALKYKKNFQGEMKQAKENGELFWVSVNIQPKLQQNVLIGYDVIMHDITDKKINEELLVTDGLTHLYNRRHFNDIFPRMIQTTKRDGGFLSFLLFDLDNFKLYNDTYGHQAGDNALIKVAEVLRESLKRGYDYSFRLGGEEFAVVYKSSSEHDAYLFAQKIRKNIAALGIKHEKNGDEGVLTASFGLITLRDYDLTNDDDIYKRADDYLYRAKKEGRNRVVSRIL
jgi:diguanylate cyclase (GGDEF)-like protein/PAS domain S-box-containing protein